jgi:hypothetical protein
MRAAALSAGAIIAVGIFLGIAATFAFSPTWIGIGILAIGVLAAIGIMAASGPSLRSQSRSELRG